MAMKDIRIKSEALQWDRGIHCSTVEELRNVLWYLEGYENFIWPSGKKVSYKDAEERFSTYGERTVLFWVKPYQLVLGNTGYRGSWKIYEYDEVVYNLDRTKLVEIRRNELEK